MPSGLYGADMKKHIVPSIHRSDEAKSLVGVIPFYDTLWASSSLHISIISLRPIT